MTSFKKASGFLKTTIHFNIKAEEATDDISSYSACWYGDATLFRIEDWISATLNLPFLSFPSTFFALYQVQAVPDTRAIHCLSSLSFCISYAGSKKTFLEFRALVNISFNNMI
jgi:hypothetical protein